MLHQSPALDLAFQALADPARRVMVERLVRGPASVSELARPLDMTLSAVVQHVAVLEASGLVRSQKSGRVRTCRIEPAALRQAERWISERRTTWERRFDPGLPGVRRPDDQAALVRRARGLGGRAVRDGLPRRRARDEPRRAEGRPGPHLREPLPGHRAERAHHLRV
ncbi:MAG: helix-turn-helix transcriptional regulator [Chloroflexi bacterium]|nr:MAG: helix-turn-helix transcriptional regulator [Chloroflexota bacterium]